MTSSTPCRTSVTEASEEQEPPTPFELVATACVVGLRGAVLAPVIAILMLALFSSSILNLGDVERDRNFIIVTMVLWGLAFMRTHMVFLRHMHVSVRRSPFRVTVFACLAFCVPAFTVLAIVEPDDVAAFIVACMAPGLGITILGLVLWVKLRVGSDGSAS